MALPQEPLVLLNGVCLNDDVRYQLHVSSYESLMKEATRRPPAVRQTYGRNNRVMPQVDAFLERQVRLLVELLRCENWLTKQKLRGALVAACSKLPNKLQVGALVCEPTLTEVAIPDRQDIHLPDRGSVELVGEVHDATWKRVYNQCAGDPTPGAVPGFIVRDDRPDHASLKGTGNPIAVTNPGSAATYLVARFSNASYANTAVYIRSDHPDSDSRIVVTLDAFGVGEIEEAHALLLPPGKQNIYFEDSGGTALASGTWAMGWAETEWRFLGDDGGHMDECPAVFELQRTGSATYISTAGTLTTTTDSQPRVGLPVVMRRNLFTASKDLANAAWTTSGTLTRTVAGKGPFGTYDAWTLTDGDSGAASSLQQTHTTTVSTDWFTGSVYVLQSSAANIVGLYFFYLTPSADVFIHLNTATGATQVTQGSGTAVVSSVLDEDGRTWYRVSLAKQGNSNASATLRIYPALTNSMGAATVNSLTGSVTVWSPQLDRASAVTPSQVTNASGVDVSHVVNGPGLPLEGAVTNLFTSNQATGSDTLANTTGFNRVGGVGTLTSDTTAGKVHQGSRAIKYVTPGSGSGEGIFLDTFPVTAGQTYCVQFSLAGSAAGTRLNFNLTDNGVPAVADKTIITQTSPDTVFLTITASAGATACTVLVTTLDTVATSLWFDAFLAWNGPFPVSWRDGPGNADSCGTMLRHNWLKEAYNPSKSTAWQVAGSGGVALPSSTPVSGPDGLLSAYTWDIKATDNRLLQLTGITPNDGKAINATGWVGEATLKLDGFPTSGNMQLRIEDQAGVTLGTATTIGSGGLATSASEFLTFPVAIAASAISGSVTALNLRLKGGSSGTGTVILAAFGLRRGSLATRQIARTTGSPVLPDDGDWVAPDGFWQNMEIEFYIVPGPPTPPNFVDVGLFGSTMLSGSANILRLFRSSGQTSSSHAIHFDRAHNGSTGFGGIAGRSLVNSASGDTFFDQGRHLVKIACGNYLLDGKRNMPQELYVDDMDTPKATADAAALYGATEWRELERIIASLLGYSPIFATIQGLKIRFRRPPAGAIVMAA